MSKSQPRVFSLTFRYWRQWLALAAGTVVWSAADSSLAAQCVTSGSATACGFACRSSYGELRCAQTADGICHIGSGKVVCWDPPAILHRIFDGHTPTPSCLTSGGQTACGYSCIANYDQVQCAQTPFGACAANEGKLVCWDPPAPILLSMGKRTPHAGCVTNYGSVACGYSCVANNGVLRCAQTPDGSCRSERDTAFCWDPPLDSMAVVFDPASEMACLSSSGGRSCGFRCLATQTLIGCGTSRQDSCRLGNESIVCSAP